MLEGFSGRAAMLSPQSLNHRAMCEERRTNRLVDPLSSDRHVFRETGGLLELCPARSDANRCNLRFLENTNVVEREFVDTFCLVGLVRQ